MIWLIFLHPSTNSSKLCNMALIDKDQIRAEIERQKEINKRLLDGQLRDGCLYAYNQVLSFLDSLPEQPAQGLDVTDFCKPVDPGIAKCVADHWWELLDDENAADKKAVKEIVKTVHKEVTRQVKEMVKEQPGEGLEEEMDEMWLEFCEDVDYLVYACIARHFAEWGMNQCPLPEDTTIFQKGVAEGKRLMMEEAVEGYVNYYEDSGGILMAEAQVGCPYHNGDKVKIIVIKEEQK